MRDGVGAEFLVNESLAVGAERRVFGIPDLHLVGGIMQRAFQLALHQLVECHFKQHEEKD